MSLERLPILTELQATPRATPKHRLPTKLDRAVARKAARLADRKALRAWALAVKTRDRWLDRKTRQRLRTTADLDPLRAEAHHIVSRDDPAVRTDVRNGICLSFATHAAVERGDYRIEGTVWFRKGGARYVDATYPVVFVRVR